MANAKKCDRCGVCFDPFNLKQAMCSFRNPMFKETQNIRDGTIGELLILAHPDDYVDLCPNCAHEFRLFMKGWKIAYELSENENFEDALQKYFEDEYYRTDGAPNEGEKEE